MRIGAAQRFASRVQEVAGMLLPNVLYSKVVDDESKCDWTGGVRPEARGVFGRSISVGGEDGG